MSDRDPSVSVSPYTPLEPPEYRSQIPAHLLSHASEQEQYIMGQLSILSQHADWSVHAHLSQDKQLRYTNGKVRQHEVDIKAFKDDKAFLGRGWKFLVATAGVVGGLISFGIHVFKLLIAG